MDFSLQSLYQHHICYMELQKALLALSPCHNKEPMSVELVATTTANALINVYHHYLEW